MGWWAIVVLATSSIRLKKTERWLRRLNLVAGTVITLFGAIAVVTALR
jgi:hypothetical protein